MEGHGGGWRGGVKNVAAGGLVVTRDTLFSKYDAAHYRVA